MGGFHHQFLHVCVGGESRCSLQTVEGTMSAPSQGSMALMGHVLQFPRTSVGKQRGFALVHLGGNVGIVGCSLQYLV
jgi:hypothetical protein